MSVREGSLLPDAHRVEATSFHHLIEAASGEPRFRAKIIPVMTLDPDLHTATNRRIVQLILADERSTYLLYNAWIGDTPSEDQDDYPEPVWETLVLKSDVELFDTLHHSKPYHIKLDTGSVLSGSGGWEVFPTSEGLFGIKYIRCCTTFFSGSPRDFLSLMKFSGVLGGWRLQQSSSPQFYDLTCNAEESQFAL